MKTDNLTYSLYNRRIVIFVERVPRYPAVHEGALHRQAARLDVRRGHRKVQLSSSVKHRLVQSQHLLVKSYQILVQSTMDGLTLSCSVAEPEPLLF